MYYSLKNFSLIGLNAILIEIEIDVNKGMPNFIIVGMADTALKEARERVISAIKNSGFEFIPKKTIVNFSPADLKKEGACFDLPIAIGFLIASEQIPKVDLADTVLIGELSLDGKVKHTKGILPVTITAQNHGIKNIIVPYSNFYEANLVKGINIIPVKELKDVLNYFYKGIKLEMNKPEDTEKTLYEFDFSEIKGQYFAKRAIEVAAAGAHNILMVGPPGSGKTMIARRIPTILPEMTFEEALQTTKIYSIAGKLNHISSLIKTRPFRAPHHTISDVALIGGGSYPKPGEISLSNNGVLFLDEFAEYKKNALEALRQPLEDGFVTISRAKDSVSFPARFILISSMNPCPCGYMGDDSKECTCTPLQVKKYFSKISGPILDRIDIQIEVKSLKYNDMVAKEQGEKSEIIRNRVKHSSEIQKKRFKNEKNTFFNSQMSSKQIKKYCELDDSCLSLLKNAIEKLSLSARAYDRILRVSRTIADLDNSENIKTSHVAEAIQYRSLDRII